MAGIRVEKKNAEAVRAYLKAHKLMDKQHCVLSRNSFIYFPMLRPGAGEMAHLKKLGAEPTDAAFMRQKMPRGYRDALLKELGMRGYEKAVKSYDLVGDTAIIDARHGLAMKIAKALSVSDRRIKRVISKAGAVKGSFRTRDFRHVWGRKGYEVEYRENGILLSLDIRKAFFSPRLAYERKRISDSARDGENVVVMFAGAGPFDILLAKSHVHDAVVAIEMNRDAHRYHLRNIALNKVANVVPILGDVRDFGARYRGFADRIVMPLPRDSHHFLETAAAMAGKRCIIHYYAFAGKGEPYSHHLELLRSFFSARGRKVRILLKRIVRTYSPAEDEIVIDFMVY